MKKEIIILSAFSGILLLGSCKKKELCFSNELSGNYVGDLTEYSTGTVAYDAAGNVSVNGCEKLTIKITSPINKTYVINKITTANGTSYTAKTDSGNEATIRYISSTKTIEVSIDPGFTYNAVKQ